MHLARTRYLLPAATVALILTACGSDPAPTSAGSSTSESAKATTFVLDEWSVTPPSGDLKAGKVAISVTNSGTEIHELVIVRAEDAGSLPTKSDGSVDEDKIPDSKKAGEIADLAAGKTATKTLDLAAGDYVAFCNIVESTGGMSNGGMDQSGMGSTGMTGGTDSTMGTSGGMDHVHYQLGMVTKFTAS